MVYHTSKGHKSYKLNLKTYRIKDKSLKFFTSNINKNQSAKLIECKTNNYNQLWIKRRIFKIKSKYLKCLRKLWMWKKYVRQTNSKNQKTSIMMKILKTPLF